VLGTIVLWKSSGTGTTILFKTTEPSTVETPVSAFFCSWKTDRVFWKENVPSTGSLSLSLIALSLKSPLAQFRAKAKELGFKILRVIYDDGRTGFAAADRDGPWH